MAIASDEALRAVPLNSWRDQMRTVSATAVPLPISRPPPARLVARESAVPDVAGPDDVLGRDAASTDFSYLLSGGWSAFPALHLRPHVYPHTLIRRVRVCAIPVPYLLPTRRM